MKVLLLIVFLAMSDTTATRLERSIGGELLPIDNAPFFVSIKQLEYHLCGGALITSKHILTAAHCLVDESDKVRHNLRVVSGTAQKYHEGTSHNIDHLFIAPGFDLQGLRNDIAVIVLSQIIKWNIKEYKILLPSAEVRTFGTADFIAFASTDNPLENSRLHEIKIKLGPIDFCIGYHPIGDHVHSDKLCGLSDYYHRTYTGDSGGPLVRLGKIIGILSSTNSSNSFTSYFMDVYKFRDFINEAIKWRASYPCQSATSRYIFYPTI